MIEIIPSIIAKTKEELIEKTKILEPHVERVHLDVMDGDFVANKTISGWEELIDPTNVSLYRNISFDVHLMVSRPGDIIDRWFQTKADNYIIHIESNCNHRNLIEEIRLSGRKVALALNPETSIDTIAEFVDIIDSVQFMTVHPGNYGGEFVESVLGKISDFHKQYPNKPIVVDGAIHTETARWVVEVGASVLVLGTHIFNEGTDVGKAIEELKLLSNNK